MCKQATTIVTSQSIDKSLFATAISAMLRDNHTVSANTSHAPSFSRYPVSRLSTIRKTRRPRRRSPMTHTHQEEEEDVCSVEYPPPAPHCTSADHFDLSSKGSSTTTESRFPCVPEWPWLQTQEHTSSKMMQRLATVLA